MPAITVAGEHDRISSMNIYFSCAITGGRQDQLIYAALVEALLEDGHVVPTSSLASPTVMEAEAIISPPDVYERDVAWVKACDVVVAEVSTPSHGVGYEIALAVCSGKPVLCCYQEGRQVSKMITGNSSPGLQVFSYRTPEELVKLVRDCLKQLDRNLRP
jgi:nucleoside 2-deoxyribosyltransferase